jgi:hypothetical protein
MTIPTFALVALLATDATRDVPADACAALVPPTLQAAIVRSYPGFRPVSVSDYTAEVIRRERQYHGGSSCLGVASADVDGDGRADVGLLIVSEPGHVLVLAARSVTPSSWRLEKLADFGDGGPAQSYVGVVEAGSYEDLGLSDKKAPGQLARYKSAHPGFSAGTIDSSGVAYFFTGKRWVHLWVAD